MIRELISAVVGVESNESRMDRLYSLCCTLCAIQFSEITIPADTHALSLEKSLKYIVDCDDWLRQNSTQPPEPYFMYSNQVDKYSYGRVLYTSADRRLGLAPQATKPGDKICIILGCSSLLVLRSGNGGLNYQVVGECYLDGIMTGEAMLGELPKGWRLILKYYPEHQAHYLAFLDSATGHIQVDDPRLGALTAGWRFESHKAEDTVNRFVNDRTGEYTYSDPRLKPEILRARRVELQEFRLI